MRFGAKEAIGFDISDVAIDEAKQLAEISGLNAKFERVSILEMTNNDSIKHLDKFPLSYILIGEKWKAIR